MQIHHSRCLAP